ncbi:unnamed protein product [Sphacelaria rigidula]
MVRCDRGVHQFTILQHGNLTPLKYDAINSYSEGCFERVAHMKHGAWETHVDAGKYWTTGLPRTRNTRTGSATHTGMSVLPVCKIYRTTACLTLATEITCLTSIDNKWRSLFFGSVYELDQPKDELELSQPYIIDADEFGRDPHML